jgi:hypothetical protein
VPKSDVDERIAVSVAAVRRLGAHLAACERLLKNSKLPAYARAGALREQRYAIVELPDAEDALEVLRGSKPSPSIVDEIRARREEPHKRVVEMPRRNAQPFPGAFFRGNRRVKKPV